MHGKGGDEGKEMARKRKIIKNQRGGNEKR